LTSIQAILIGCLVIASILASFIFRARLVYRLLGILLLLTAVTLVLFPDLTTSIAHALGVGRGTDLLLYFSLIAGMHAILMLYLRIRDLERKITEQVRAMAVRDAEFSGIQ
jgi:hypothetical protein